MKLRHGLEAAGGTDPGLVRENNEDSFLIDEELGLYVVADGMGGHNSGEIASALATGTIHDRAPGVLGAKAPIPRGGAAKLSRAGRQLEYLVKSANAIIYAKGRALPKDAGMGTTVVAALVDRKTLTVAHVGDSRLYLWRQGELSLLTEDHSLVGDQVRRGLITPEQASRSRLQNILTRALGADKDVQVDVADHALLAGDVVLLASDGLTKMLTDGEIAGTIAQEEVPRDVVDALIRKARDAGGEANITVIVVQAPRSAAQPGPKSLWRKFLGFWRY